MTDYKKRTLDELVALMHTGCSLDQFYSILQLYFDDVVDKNQPVEVFDRLMQAAIKAENDRFTGSCPGPIVSDIEVPESPRFRTAKGKRIPVDSERYIILFDVLSNGDYSFDEIIGVASAGIEPAAVAAAALGQISPIILRYSVRSSHYRPRDFSVRCPYKIEEKVSGKKLLLLEDFIETGETVSEVLRYLNRFDPESITIISLGCSIDIGNGYHLGFHMRKNDNKIAELRVPPIPLNKFPTIVDLPEPLVSLAYYPQYIFPRVDNGVYYVPAGNDILAISGDKYGYKLWILDYPHDIIRLFSPGQQNDLAIESQTDTQIKRFLDNEWKPFTPAQYLLEYARRRLNGQKLYK